MYFPFVDIAIAAIVVAAVIMGSRRGFLRSLLKLGSFVLASLFAYMLAGEILKITGNWFGIKAGALAIFDAIFKLVTIIILFSIFEIIFVFIEKRIRAARSGRGVSVVGKTLGLSVGFLNAVVVIAVFLALVVILFPGENPIISQVEKSVIGRFVLERSRLPAFVQTYLI